jgi:hypothetical protein
MQVAAMEFPVDPAHASDLKQKLDKERAMQLQVVQLEGSGGGWG